jgi:hypothetical protein
MGREWTYSVRSGYSSRVETLRVHERLSVAGVSGWELAGPLGVIRVARKGSQIVAQRLAGADFDPPLPLLIDSAEAANLKWSGKLSHIDGVSKARAEISQTLSKAQFKGESVQALRTVLNLQTPKHRIEILTWYVAGLGPIRQEQRTDGRLDVALQLL